jgi:hypothetical protein
MPKQPLTPEAQNLFNEFIKSFDEELKRVQGKEAKARVIDWFIKWAEGMEENLNQQQSN